MGTLSLTSDIMGIHQVGVNRVSYLRCTHVLTNYWRLCTCYKKHIHTSTYHVCIVKFRSWKDEKWTLSLYSDLFSPITGEWMECIRLLYMLSVIFSQFRQFSWHTSTNYLLVQIESRQCIRILCKVHVIAHPWMTRVLWISFNFCFVGSIASSSYAFLLVRH